MMSLCGAYYEDLLDPRTDLTVICCCPVKGCGQEVAKHAKKPVAPGETTSFCFPSILIGPVFDLYL